MSIVVTSTTDSKEQVQAAMGNLARPESSVDKKQSATSQKSEVETREDSEALQTDDEKVLGTKDGDVDDSSEDESDTREGDQKPKKNGFGKRIDKLNKKLSAAAQELEYWKSQALKSESANPGKTQNPETSIQNKEAAVKDTRPKAEDFESHAEYVEALTDWKIEEREKTREAKARQTQVKTEYDMQKQKHFDRVNDFVKSHDDFHDAIEEISDIPMSLTVEQAILDSENGPALMYELSKNRDEFERICRMHPVKAAMELGRIEARISKSSDEPIKEVKTTKAPPPVRPVGSKGVAVKKDIYNPNLSQAEYEALRREQLRNGA